MKYDKDVALLGALAISFIGGCYPETIEESVFVNLKEELFKCDYILDTYDGVEEIEIVKDVIKAIQNLQVTSEEYNALERGE